LNSCEIRDVPSIFETACVLHEPAPPPPVGDGQLMLKIVVATEDMGSVADDD
jgi:hypothetical protein